MRIIFSTIFGYIAISQDNMAESRDIRPYWGGSSTVAAKFDQLFRTPDTSFAARPYPADRLRFTNAFLLFSTISVYVRPIFS